jgi:hypothetical protein
MSRDFTGFRRVGTADADTLGLGPICTPPRTSTPCSLVTAMTRHECYKPPCPHVCTATTVPDISASSLQAVTSVALYSDHHRIAIFFARFSKGRGEGGTPERMKITRLSPALSAQTQDYYQQKSTALDLRVATAGRTRARGFQSEIGSQRFVALRCRELCSLYRGNLKFTVICVWISTGDPSSR